MWKVYKCSSTQEVLMTEADTEEKAYKKMLSLIKKETKTTEYVKQIETNVEPPYKVYDYGMWGRAYKIIEEEK